MDLGVYVPFGLGVLTASFLIWKFPLTVPRERIPMVIATFLGAYVLFVVLDVASGRALTTYADIPKTFAVFGVALLVLAIANFAYLRFGPRYRPVAPDASRML